jgi:hypothetical protein
VTRCARPVRVLGGLTVRPSSGQASRPLTLWVMRNQHQHGGFYRQQPVDSDRGLHPDLTPEGNIKATAYLPPPEREFIEMWQDDARRAAFFDQVTRSQMDLPGEVQQAVAGQTFGAGEGPYVGFKKYREEIELARRDWGYDKTFTSADVEKMSLDEYNAVFDERGQVRAGYTYQPTARDVRTDMEGGIDRYSRGELRSNRP